MNKFSVAGVSADEHGHYKVRFANDLVSRVKILIKSNHTDVHLMDLPSRMTKPEVVIYLGTTKLVDNPKFAEAIDNAYFKYNSLGRVTHTSTKVKAAPSIESILARASTKESA